MGSTNFCCDKVQLAAEEVLLVFRKLFQHCIFKFLKSIIFLKVDCELDFLSSQCGQDQMDDH